MPPRLERRAIAQHTDGALRILIIKPLWPDASFARRPPAFRRAGAFRRGGKRKHSDSPSKRDGDEGLTQSHDGFNLRVQRFVQGRLL